jgi:hypothetical protein
MCPGCFAATITPMTPTIHSRRIATATLATLALAAPAATARPLTDRPAAPTPAPAAPAADASLDWGSAGIGAATAAGLVLIAAGGFAATRTRLAS